MRALYLFILITACFLSSINAQTWPPNDEQPCLPGGITFTNQDQLDQFALLYPDCTKIEGHVIIQESVPSNITSLSGLSQITSIAGDLRIVSNQALSSLDGLNNLASISGALNIFENDALVHLTALQQLETMLGHLTVAKNDLLTDISGLENIYFGITNLRVFANPLLSICSLSNICQYLSNGGTHTIATNDTGCNSRQEISSSCLSNNPCTKNILSVNLNPILSGQYQAIQIVNSFGQIPFGETVTFKAGNCINLEAGFTVQANVTFSAEITDCGL